MGIDASNIYEPFIHKIEYYLLTAIGNLEQVGMKMRLLFCVCNST